MPRIMIATSAAYPDLSPADQLYRAALERRGARSKLVFGATPVRGFATPILSLSAAHGTTTVISPAIVPGSTPSSRLARRWQTRSHLCGGIWTRPISTSSPPRGFLFRRNASCPVISKQRAELWRRSVGSRQSRSPASARAGTVSLSVTAATLDTIWAELATAVSPHKLVLQEYVSEIQAEGQISYVFLGGRFVHAVRFRPRAGEFRINSKFEPQREVVSPQESDIEDATRVIAALPVSPVYARIDMVRRKGRQLLLEAEVNEPGLLFQYVPAGADTFAVETLAWLNR